MQAYIFGLTAPLIPLLLRKLYKKDEQLRGRELLFRYVINTLLMTVFATIVMVFLCDDNTSFLAKVDSSSLFALKFLAVELVGAALVTAADWIYETKKVVFALDKQSFQTHPVITVFRRIAPFMLYVLAAAVIILNVLMIFDNVLWGDEAFSANTVRNDFGGIMQILTFVDCHPPLYYFWLKLWSMLFGESGPVYHLASVTLFVTGAVLATTLVRKRYGKIPAAFFLVLSGLSASCLEYNVEIRMYAMAFLAVAYCYYCAAQILRKNRPLSWIGMVLWGAVAAYAHYYALLSVVILMVAACLFAVKRYGKKTWIKVLIAGVAFILIYLPWLSMMFKTVADVTQNWWDAVSATPKECITVMFGGDNMSKWSFPLCLLLFLIILLVESSIVRKHKDGDKWRVEFHAPGWKEWSAELDALAVGVAAIAGTLIVALWSIEFTELVLARRYVYPLAGVAAVMLVIVSSRFLRLLQSVGDRIKAGWLLNAGKCLLVLVLLAMLFTGIGDYRRFTAESKYQSVRTEELLNIVGEPTENMVLVSNGVTHIGWTVLNYYYPRAEVLNGRWDSTQADDFWYFTVNPLTAEEMAAIDASGAHIAESYPSMQLVKYPLSLYHIVREAE